MKKNSIIFETERLFLKPINLDDADLILELLNMPKWIQYIGDRNVKSKEAAEQYIKEKMLPQYERLGFGNFTVVRKSDQQKLGTCGLYDREGLEGVDIGFAFLPQYEKKGYAHESAQKVKELGIQQFGIKKINAITTQDNFASQKLLKKLGFTYTKMIRIPNDKEELMLFEFEQL